MGLYLPILRFTRHYSALSMLGSSISIIALSKAVSGRLNNEPYQFLVANIAKIYKFVLTLGKCPSCFTGAIKALDLLQLFLGRCSWLLNSREHLPNQGKSCIAAPAIAPSLRCQPRLCNFTKSLSSFHLGTTARTVHNLASGPWSVQRLSLC